MNRSDIKNAYDLSNPTREQKEKMLTNILALAPEKEGKQMKYHTKHTAPRKWNAVPAVLALILVVSVGLFFLVGQESKREAANGNYGDILQTVQNSALYRAGMEWYTYMEGEAQNTQEDGTVLPIAYRIAGCENNEMKQKLDEICKKYALTLEIEDEVGSDSYETVREDLNLTDVFSNKDGVEYETGSFFWCSDGNLVFDGIMTLGYDGSPWSEPIRYTYRRMNKQVFDGTFWENGPLENYEYWVYETENGANLILANNNNQALILADMADYLVMVRAEYDGVYGKQNMMNGTALEAFAETFDFNPMDILQSMQVNPQYLANVEWNEYLKACEEELNDSEANLTLERYAVFQCESEEMTEELDEVCEKYGLVLKGTEEAIQDYDKLMAILGLDSVCVEKNGVSHVLSGGSYITDGTFQFSGETTLGYEGTPWIYGIDFSFHYIRGTVFHDALIEIGDISQYDSWEYTTENGVDTLLAVNSEKAIILTYRGNELIFVLVKNPTVKVREAAAYTMGREAIEAFAETFDLTLAPTGGPKKIDDTQGIVKETVDVYSQPGPDGSVLGQIAEGTSIEILSRVSFSNGRWGLTQQGWILLDKVQELYSVEPGVGDTESEPVVTEGTKDTYEDILETYEAALSEKWTKGQCVQESISYMVSDFVNTPGKLGYTLIDLDGDGNDELLITDGKYIYDMYTLTAEGPIWYISGWERNTFQLCDGYAIANVMHKSAFNRVYSFCRFQEGELVEEQIVTFNSKEGESLWTSGTSDEPITAGEAQEIIDSYLTVDIDFEPFLLRIN